MPAAVVAVHTGRRSARRVARSRRAENDVMQTRSQAAVRRSTPASGPTAGESLTSMLNRACGQAPSRSSSRGMGSVPAIRAAATVLCGRAPIRPVASVTRSSVLS